MSENEESMNLSYLAGSSGNQNPQEPVPKPTTDPASLSFRQTKFHLKGTIVATIGIRIFKTKVYFGLLLAIGTTLLKINLWNNFAKVWAKRIIVGWTMGQWESPTVSWTALMTTTEWAHYLSKCVSVVNHRTPVLTSTSGHSSGFIFYAYPFRIVLSKRIVHYLAQRIL